MGGERARERGIRGQRGRRRGKGGGGIQGGWLLVSNVAAADPITSRSCRIKWFFL